MTEVWISSQSERPSAGSGDAPEASIGTVSPEHSRDPGLKPDGEMDLVGKIVTYGFFTLLWAALLNSLLQLVL